MIGCLRLRFAQSSRLRSLRTFSAIFVVVMLITTITSTASFAQDEDDREKITAERFLQVLMRRPRPGTSLDRVYGYHVRNGSLDELISSLKNQEDKTSKGPSMMVLGLIQLQRGKSADAVEALKAAEELLPEDAACSFYLGKAHLGVGATELAAAAMERSIERRPARNEALPIFTELGRIYGRAGLGDKALGVWTKLEALFPGDTRVGGKIARTLAEEGNVEEALKRYSSLAKSARREEEKIAFAVQAAEMKRRLGQNDEATTDLEKILAKLRPGSWLYTDVRNRIEQGFLKSGNFDALADYYQKQLESQSDNLEMMTRLGSILVSAGRLEEAQKTLDAASERAPEDQSVRLALVDVLTRQAKYDDAVAQFEELAKLDPGNPDYLLRWGQTLLDDGDKELEQRRSAAADVWQKLADARSDDAVTIAQVADRLRGIDRSDEALKLYRKAIEVDGDSPQYREYLGEYLHQLDRKDEAIEAWEAIAADDRRDVNSLIRLAEIFNTFKLADRSLQAWDAASEFDLNFSQELRFAKQLRTARQFEKAQQRLDRAERLAETPDEREQLLRDRIATYSDAGTLQKQITELAEQRNPTTDDLRQLAMLHQAAGQLTNAAITIQKAIKSDPENIPALSVAADIAERQNKFADAVLQYQKLSTADRRFQTSYLEKIAQLQVRMGLTEDALATCELLIDANPASTDTYQFAARTAFRLGRSDEGTEILRRAMNIARRDNGPRKMLADQFAQQYRTDEAIDLYWQALELDSKAESRIGLVQNLAPLYERKGEFEELLKRIEEIGAKDNDQRATQLMIAAANEAIEDYGAARQAVDRLLAQQPRDVALLQDMVRLCDAADELELAIEFQKRINGLANTPENRFKLVRLQLDAGAINVVEALSQQVSLNSDPSRVTGMIRGAAGRGDLPTAIALSREMLKHDDGLWDVKLTLAQLLLHQNPDDEEEAEKTEKKVPRTGDEKADDTKAETKEPSLPKIYQEVVALCEEVKNSDVALDALPPTASKKQRTSGASRTSPQNWSNSGYSIARAYRLGQYARYSYSSSRGKQTVAPYSFGHARVLAETLICAAYSKTMSPGQFAEWLKPHQKKITALPEDINDIRSINEIHYSEALTSMLNYVVDSSAVPPAPAEKPDWKRRQDITWRMFTLDPDAGSGRMRGWLQSRLKRTITRRRWDAEQKANKDTGEKKNNEETAGKQKEPQKIPGPISKERMQKLLVYYDSELGKVRADAKKSESTLLRWKAVLRNELELAGRTEEAEKYKVGDVPEDASLQDLIAAINFYLSLDQVKDADALVPRLMPAVRIAQRDGKTISGLSSSSISGSVSSTFSSNPDFRERHKFTLLDVVLAVQMQRSKSSQRNSRSSIGTGTLRVYYQRSPNSGWSSGEVKGPLATELVNEQLAREICAFKIKDEERPTRPGYVSPTVIDHLLKPVKGAPIFEQKTRRALAAFAHWWNDRPQQCYDIVAELADEFSDDVNLRVEHARLASELGDDRKALDILNSFEPLDSEMLVRKEMAAMNLAVRVGDQPRAAQAAERLFGMRMATGTQLALAEQLRLLGMKDKADAVLNRMRGGRRQTESTMLQIAQAFVKADAKEAAAEVAYNLLRRTNRRSSQSNNDYYRQQAVSILKSANRLDPLIAMAKRRVESAPKSVAARSELAELYIASGEKDKADALWVDIAKSGSVPPAQLVSQAQNLYRSKKYKEAMELYFKAFRKDASLLDRYFYNVQNVARSGKLDDEMYKQLLTIDIDQVRDYRLDDMLRNYGRSSGLTQNKRKFIERLLERRSLGYAMYNVLEAIPKNEWKTFPKLREAILREVTSPAALTGQSKVWSVRSYGQDGKANGSFGPIMRFIAEDKESQKKFRETLAKAKENENTAGEAMFFEAILNMLTGDKDAKAEAAATMTKMMKRLTAEKVRNGSYSQAVWQAGLLIETIDDIPDRPKLLVLIYDTAAKAGDRNNNSPRYTVVARQIHALNAIGYHRRARNLILKAYREADFSEQNQYNPGYGDYQDLQVWSWSAEQLIKCNHPIDALSIYRRGIASPEKFEKSKRWGGGQSIDQFVQAEKKAAKLITPTRAYTWLNTVVPAILSEQIAAEETKKQGKIRPEKLDLMLLPVSAFEDEELQSGFLMAVQKMKSSQESREKLPEIAARLEAATATEDADWSFLAARIVVTAASEPQAVPTLLTQLIAKLPATAVLTSDFKELKRAETARLQQNFVVLEALEANKIEVEASITQTLLEIIKAAASAVGDTDSELLLETRFGDAEGSINKLLAQLDEATQDLAPSPKNAKTLLKIASTAASKKRFDQSAEALSLALRWGPPLKTLTSDSGDAFAIRNNRSPSSNQTEDPVQAEIGTKVLELMKLYDAAIVKFAGTEEPKDGEKEGLKKLYEALKIAVLPPKRTNVVALYESRIAPRTNYANFSGALDSNGLPPTNSAGRTLASFASALGQADDLLKSIDDAKPSQVDTATLKLHLARAAKDRDALLEGLREFEAAYENILPAADAKAAVNTGSITITTALQKQTAEIADHANKVLHAVWPLDQKEFGKDDEITELRMQLLNRTVALINSEQYTSQRLRSISQALNGNNFTVASRTQNRSLMSSILSGISNAIASTYSHNPEYIAQEEVRRYGTLLQQMRESGNLANADTVLRRLLMSQAKMKPNYKSQSIAQTLLTICEMPDSEQFELLGKVVLSEKAGDDILNGFGVLWYSEVPSLVRDQSTSVEKISQVPTAGTAQITDITLALARVAARLNMSEKLAKEVASRSTESGDNADLVSTLLTLTSAKDGYKAVERKMDEIGKHLTETKPDKTDSSLSFPELECIIVMEAIERGMPQQKAAELTNVLKWHAIHGEKNELISVIGDIRSKLGVGRAANGSVESPLEHFVPVSIPWSSDPHLANRRPMHAVNNGWVSSTGGSNINILMLKYPVEGEFWATANIKDGGWGEADMTYGGTLYQPQGWNKKGEMNILRGGIDLKVDVANINAGKVNQEGVAVKGDEVAATCNKEKYFEDIRDASFPWLGVTQYGYRTTQWKDFKVEGSPIIPRDVSLLSRTMRGWDAFYYASQLPDVLLKKDGDKPQVSSSSNAYAPDGYSMGKWIFKDDEFVFQSHSELNQDGYDPGTQLKYQRPILPGETCRMEFWWESGKVEISPAIGGINFGLSKEGITTTFVTRGNDLAAAANHMVAVAEEPKEKPEPLTTEVTPLEKSWNTFTLSRQDNQMTASLNDKEVATWEVSNLTAFPGFSRENGKGARVKSIVLSGDWPEKLPADLMRPASADKSTATE